MLAIALTVNRHRRKNAALMHGDIAGGFDAMAVIGVTWAVCVPDSWRRLFCEITSGQRLERMLKDGFSKSSSKAMQQRSTGASVRHCCFTIL